jgi:hypothetical protein
MWLLAGDTNTTWHLKVLPVLKWYPILWKLKPYLLAGVGFDYQLNYPGAVPTWNMALPLGAGVQWDLHPRYRLFLEATYNFLFFGPRVATQDVPILLGFSIDL